jgi:hypothetical protein
MKTILLKQFPDAGRIQRKNSIPVQCNYNIPDTGRMNGKPRIPALVHINGKPRTSVLAHILTRARIHKISLPDKPAGFQLKAVLMAALALFSLVSLGSSDASAQKVFSVDYPNQADLRVYVVRYQNQADLNVFRVQYQNQAGENDGRWFFTDYPNQADKKIYFVDYPNQADLKIHFVRYRNQAGWRSNARKHLMY